MTIDGKDVYTEWGCKLLEGSFDDLLKYTGHRTKRICVGRLKML